MAPASPMKIRAGLKLWGRNPTAMPTTMTATSGPDVRALEQPGLEQPVGVEEQREAGDRGDPGREAVEAVDEVHRVGQDHDADDGEQRREVGRQDDVLVARERHPEVEHRHAEQREETPRQHLARDLGRRRHLAHVVDGADHDHHCRGEQDADRLRRTLEHLVELVELRRRRASRRAARGTSPAPPSVGVGFGVHGPRARLGHRADAGREPPHRGT